MMRHGAAFTGTRVYGAIAAYSIRFCFVVASCGLLSCVRPAPVAPIAPVAPEVYVLRRLDTIVVNACRLVGERTPIKNMDLAPLLNAMGQGCEADVATAHQLTLADGKLNVFEYEPPSKSCNIIFDMHGERGEFLAAFHNYIQYGCIRRIQGAWLLDFGTIMQE